MIHVKDLTYQYKSQQEVLTFPDLKLETNDHLLVLGKSGVGKTTLLHLMAGLLSPKAGEIRIGETVINQLSDRKQDQFRGRHIGLVFQNNHAISSLTVIENLKLDCSLPKRK